MAVYTLGSLIQSPAAICCQLLGICFSGTAGSPLMVVVGAFGNVDEMVDETLVLTMDVLLINESKCRGYSPAKKNPRGSNNFEAFVGSVLYLRCIEESFAKTTKKRLRC